MTLMRPIDDLLPMVTPHAPSAPEPVVLRYLRAAAIELCDRAPLWRERDSMTIADPDYEGLCTLADAAIVRVEKAWLNDRQIEPKSIGWLDDNRPNWDMDPQEGPASFLTQLQPNTVTVVPRETGTLKVRLVLKPSATAETLPAFLVEDFGEQLGKGAAGRLLVMPAGEWVNPNLGAALISEFRAIVNTAMIRATKGQQNAPLRTIASYL